MKRGGGRRLYRPGDVQLLRGIRDLLQDAGYTIKGVQKILREDGIERVKVAGEGGPSGLDAGEAGRVVTYARADKLVRFSSMEVEALRAVAAELSACQALLLASTSSKAAGQHDKRVSRS
jgi:DNA-binding transcriptional MerR regulator